MNQTSESQKTWLVKSSGTVLGPFALEEVIQHLTNKRIALIDEVRSPESRWMFIREHKQFANIVQFLREQQLEAKEDTGATFVGNRTITPAPEESTAFPTATVPANQPTAAAAAQPAPSANAAPAPAADSRPITYAPGGPAPQKEMRIQRGEDRRWVTVLLWFTLVVVGAAGAMYFGVLNKEAPKALGYMDYIKLAQAQSDLGHYDQALNMYRKAESIQKLNVNHRMQMTPLLMVVEKQNVQARQIMDEIRQEVQLNPKLEADINNQMAFSYLNEGQLAEARKRYTEITKANPNVEPAQVNLMEISILEGQFQETVDSLRALMKIGVKDPLVYLYRSMAAYRLYNETDKLENVVEDLKRYVGRYQDYQLETYLLIAATQLKLTKAQDSSMSVKAMLQADPDLTRKHVHELLVHREVFDWGYLGNICELLVKAPSDSPQIKGLAAFCSYQSGDIKKAIESIDKARAQFAADPTLMGLHTFLLFKSGRQQEAKALIQTSNGSNNELLVSTHAWICQEEKDWDCAEREWKRIHAQNPQNLAAFAGLAKMAIAQGDADRAKDLIQQGLLVSSHYRPFLELKDQVDGR